MTNPTDHELNAVLARVAGVEIAEFRSEEWYCAANPADIASGSMRWNPLHDANQMEWVEEALVKVGLLFKVGWYGSQYEAWVGTEIDPMGVADGEFGFDLDKKRAFALAVYAIEQSQSRL